MSSLKIKDILQQLLNGNEISDIFGKKPSENGYIFEAIYKILVIDKKITSIPLKYNKIYNCQMSDLINSRDVSNVKEIYKENVCNASGGKSDLITEYSGCFTLTSCKLKSKFIPGESDIEKLNNEASADLKLDEEEYNLSFVCKDKDKVKDHIHKHKNVKKYFDKIIENNLLFDLNDIELGMKEFYKLHNNKSYDEYCNYINSEYLGNNRILLIERLHQRMTLNRFINNFNKNEKKHLISHKTRTGKSITQLLIIKWLIDNNKKVLFMTSVPSTIISFIDDLEKYIIFKNIKYHKLGGNKEEICISINSLTLCSIQYLKNDINGNKKQFLKKQKYDIMLIDECHYGSSTKKTKDNIIDIDKNTEEIRNSAKISIFSSGTSKKTQKFYKIKNTCIYKWELFDESQMKLLHSDSYKNNEIINNMTLRHGDEFKNVIEDSTLNKDYTNMPTQMLMKATIPECLVKQIEEYKIKYNKDIGFSLKSLFSLQTKIKIIENDSYQITYLPKFELEETTDGESILENYLDNIISNNKMKNTVMKRIEKAQSNYDSRKSTKESPKLFIMYLPTHTRNSSIDMLQRALINFLDRKNLWTKYNIVSANSKENMGDYKKEYNDEIICAMNETKLNNKIGCILLLGDKGTTGITYDDCDVSIHLDDGHNLESQIQKRARPGTPAKDKIIFINVDMNIQRSLYTLSDIVKQYQVGNKKNYSYKEILVYLYKNNIFLWNDEDFNNGEMNPTKLDSYFQKLSEKLCNEIDYIQIMNELCEEIDCDDDLKNHIDGTISINNYTPTSNPDLDGEQKNVPKGNDTKIEIDRIKKEQINKLEDNDEEGKEEIVKIIEDTINKTEELAKSKRGLPFLALVMRVKNPVDIKILIDKESNLIKEILKPKISKIEENYIYNIYKVIMNNIIDKHQDIVNQIVEIYNNTPSDKLRKIIASHFIASAEEELDNAEIPTPPNLCDDILWGGGYWPETFWTSPRKVGELCCGKGNFVIAIFDKFYEGLRNTYPNDYERCKIISTECLYFTDINPLDIFITSSILKCHIQSYCGECELDYKFNSAVCNTLETNIKDYFNIEGFDAIIGNPPYNPPGIKNTGNTIWQIFTHKAIDEWLVDGGYLAYVHPPGWRKPNTSRGKFNGMYKKMAIDNQMIYLEMHNSKDGMKVFKKGTRYDFYLLQKIERKYDTEIKDIEYNKYKCDLSKFKYLPNSNINLFIKLTNSDKKLNILCDFSYSRLDKKIVSKYKNNEFKFSLIYLTPAKGVRYMYSNVNNKGHFGISKVIIGETGYDNAIMDLEGEYGMTQDSFGILIDNIQEGENILKSLKSDKFKNFIKDSCAWSNFRIDYRLFKDINKDWWKEFINDESTQSTNVSNEVIVEVNIDNDLNEISQITETELNKMKIPMLKKYIKDNKLKIKLGQKKGDLIKSILNYYN